MNTKTAWVSNILDRTFDLSTASLILILTFLFLYVIDFISVGFAANIEFVLLIFFACIQIFSKDEQYSIRGIHKQLLAKLNNFDKFK